MTQSKFGHVLVTGGGGYVGCVLVPKLLNAGYRVTVLDLFIFGEHVFGNFANDPNLTSVKGDIRNLELLRGILPSCDSVIHLACISNDPSFELNPELGKSINYDAFVGLVSEAKNLGVGRFVYASSSSVYGLKNDPYVTEDLALQPLTDYSKYKAQCEDILDKERGDGFATVTIRPATVCGYSPRLRLDLTVNILTNHAINKGLITVFGGEQLRPNIHIEDMTDLYVNCLVYEDQLVDGQVFNAGYQNHKVRDLATIVQQVVGKSAKIKTVSTDDHRSYHVSSEKIKNVLGFVPSRSVEDSIRGLKNAFTGGMVPSPLTDPRYYNIKTMQQIALA